MATEADCQTVCDVALCEAWSFEKNKQLCYLKYRHGYTAREDTRFVSGFKNQGPWAEKDTEFDGGDICCERD